MADLTQGISEEDIRVLEMLKGKPIIKIINKADLLRDETDNDADVMVSTLTGEGIAKLKRKLCEMSFGNSLHEALWKTRLPHANTLRLNL